MERDAKTYLSSLVGKTIHTMTGQPNRVVRVLGDDVEVATGKSPDGQPVPIADVQAALDTLAVAGEVGIAPETVGYRSAFVGAVLSSIPGTVKLSKPPRIRLAGELRGLVERALATITEPKPDRYSGDHPFAELFTSELEAAVSSIVADSASYLVTGSAGQGNWAETPWVSIFDRLVTESAQRGYYVVYLFRKDGSGAYLSLNQGTTAVHEQAKAGYLEVLKDRARSYLGFLPSARRDGLHLGPIDLGGGRTALTPGYEAGSVVATHYARFEVPDDAQLARDLRRMLELYSDLISALDLVDTESLSAGFGAPPATTQEARRLQWHLRAEGRNTRAARDAKKHHGTTCLACGFNFGRVYGALGEGFIEAHHLIPFSQLDERPRDLDPAKDFAVLCSNCHRMVHRQVPPLSLEALGAILANSAGGMGVAGAVSKGPNEKTRSG